MSKTLLFEARTVLRELTALRDSLKKSSENLKKYEIYTLISSVRPDSSNTYYYVKRKGRKGRKYLGSGSNPTVRKIREARYFKKAVKIIDRDIAILEKLEHDYIIPDHDTINGMLPESYRDTRIPEFTAPNATAAEWKKRMEAEKTRHEPFRPEDLKYEAKDGTMMRSLSECLIANYLLSLGITFVYELPFIHHGKKIWPDFTILSPVDNKTVIIIEHQGAMSDASYQGKFIRTVLFYLQTRLVPNKDVFFTFNHLDRHLDLKQIDSILRIAFGFGADWQAGKAA